VRPSVYSAILLNIPTQLRFSRRLAPWLRRSALALALLACAAALFYGARLGLDRIRLAAYERRARIAAADPRVCATRMSRPGGKGLAALITSKDSVAKNPAARLELAADLATVSARVGGDAGARGEGIAYAVIGELEKAATAFSRIPASRRDAAAWNDIAAAESLAADATGDPSRQLTALNAADHALALKPAMPEALFNRARIVQSMGVTAAARRLWSELPAGVARQNLATIPQTQSDAWRAAIAQIDSADFVRLTKMFPQSARNHGEGPFLASWAEEMERGDSVAALRHLERARTVGTTLWQERGESLLLDAVHAIDRSSMQRDLIAGHLAYRNGRMLYANKDYASAERDLATAEQSLAAAHSPISAMARFYRGCVMFIQHRTDEAFDLLTRLLAEERRGGTHKALIGLTLHEISLCESVRGHWSAGLAATTESRTIFQQLGETGTAAMEEANMVENYDFLGRPDLAWRYGLSALRGASAAGDTARVRATLGALCRTELRGGRWDRAASVARLEADLITPPGEPNLDADLFLREAAAAAHLGDQSTAARAFIRARVAARKIIDPRLSDRLIADVDGAEGSILRRTDPRRGIAMLSKAIAFQTSALRPILLPELHLERGRASLAVGDLDAAERDFEDGIRELESQRGEVTEAELRPGIFDDAAQLFGEAVSLQIRRRRPAAAFTYLERGRARTLLEQIDAGPASAPSLANIQRQLQQDTALIEYTALRDKLAIFVVTHDRLVVRLVTASREMLSRAASRFIARLTSDDDDDAWRADSEQLYELLVAPLRDAVRNNSRITIVADDILQRLPFPALFDRSSGTFLIEQYAVSTAPSAGVFEVLEQRARTRERNLPSRMLVFANPTPGGTFARLAPLDAAEEEATLVARAYPSAEIVTRRNATAERFLSDAPSFPVVHFAGHAVMQNAEPGNSALVFASSGQEDGAVTSRQIARMRFDATEVVVLAACSTMTGRNAAVEGVASIARAFLVAGVPDVVGTLWDIDDRDAAPLMRTLHANIARGASPSNALRAAQISAIHAGNLESRHPKRWGAFAVMGCF